MPAPSSLVTMCAFANTLSLSIICLVGWAFVVGRVLNGCKFYGGIRNDVGHAIGDMLNRNNWCAVTPQFAQSTVGLFVGMMFVFAIPSFAIWFRTIKPLVLVNFAVVLPVQVGFGFFCFYLAAVVTNTTDFVIRPSIPGCVVAVVLGLMSMVTPAILYVSMLLCRTEALLSDQDIEEAQRADRRQFELRVRELTNEIVTHQDMERRYQQHLRGRGGGGGAGGRGRGGRGRGRGAGGRGAGGRGGNPAAQQQQASTSQFQHEMNSQHNMMNDNSNNNRTAGDISTPATVPVTESQRVESTNNAGNIDAAYTAYQNVEA